MTTFYLKLIAIGSMLIDHIGAMFFPESEIYRIVGRLAFPIFSYLLVEGFFYSRNIYRYATRLFVFALLSEVPFDLAFNESFLEFSSQNVMFTLLLGLLGMYFLEKNINYFIKILIGALTMFVAFFMSTDYSFYGILIIYAFYMLRKKLFQSIIAQIIINGLVMGGMQAYAILSMLPIAFHNGEPGRFRMKYFFYIFYPLHLLILYQVRNLI